MARMVSACLAGVCLVMKIGALISAQPMQNFRMDFHLDLDYQYQALSYEMRLSERDLRDIDLVVMHCTELPDLAMAREYGERILYEDKQTGASGHFYIDRDGSVMMWITPNRIANHTRGFNPRSIGIEIVNRGRYPNWYDSNHQKMDEPYTEAQIAAVIDLLKSLRKALPKLEFIAGHEELDLADMPASNDANKTVKRKLDPGPLFPWQRVLEKTHLKPWSAAHVDEK